jgi:hypothetical protein
MAFRMRTRRLGRVDVVKQLCRLGVYEIFVRRVQQQNFVWNCLLCLSSRDCIVIAKRNLTLCFKRQVCLGTIKSSTNVCI